MEYQITPFGSIWQDGALCVPQKIVTNYIKMASEYQLKALLLILANNGKSDSRTISKALGCKESDADDWLEFWIAEGVLATDGNAIEITAPEPEVQKTAATEQKPKKRVESVPIPTLTPKDIVVMCRESSVLTDLLRNAQEVLGKTLSHAEQEMIINMSTYYGLPAEVVLTILHYYKAEKSKGKSLGMAYISSMAKNWAEEGITTLEAADEKLKDIESSDRLWNEIIAIADIRHRNPTPKQREMIKEWSSNFSFEMISLACDAMRENAQKPSLKYIDAILKNWLKKGIKTPADVEADNLSHNTAKEKKSTGKLQSEPSFDIDEIARKAMLDDNYDI